MNAFPRCIALVSLVSGLTCYGVSHEIAAMPAARAVPAPRTAPAKQTAEPAQEKSSSAVPANPLKEAYFGDLHVHTALSIDAYITQTRTLPDDAYRYAKGLPIPHVSGQTIQLARPLDFLAVTDHSEVIGVARAMGDPSNPLSKSELAAGITSSDYETSHAAFRQIVAAGASGQAGTLIDLGAAAGAIRSAWQEVIAAAERYYEPGTFTTFVAYEWTSMPNMANLHRNVVFRGADVPPMPFASTTSSRPEDLWRFLETWRARGDDVIAIPHNSNASKGLMFDLVDSDGAPFTAEYAARRMLNEPSVEIAQFKGTSETHPALSPSDEYAGFELWETVVGGTEPVEPVPGSYIRSAYLRGLVMQSEKGFNPYKFGVIGSSDTHDSSSAVDEFNFTGGHGNADMTAEVRLNSKPSTLTTSSLNFSAAGLAGVWAEANTREAIFESLRRKETFGTSGPRIKVRFFAGPDYPDDLPERAEAVDLAYRSGVPMGGDLHLPDGASPGFFVWALRDPLSAGLDRVQIVKGWIAGGEPREAIYDVACARGTPDPVTRRCPKSEAGVDLETCKPTGEGATQLQALWRDPEPDVTPSAVYYARVIENPTCRWSTWDAVRLGVDPPAGYSAIIQERAWTSAIWVTAEEGEQ